MPTQPYIPTKNINYDNWANNFQATIAGDPAAYGLTAADATAITAAFNTWHTAFNLATDPSTRTSVTIADMVTQKASSQIVFRTYASIIGTNQGVAAPARAAAGLTIRAAGRTPIPAPGSNPILGFLAATTLQHALKYADASTPTTKAKPFGAIQLELYRYVGLTPPTGVDAYTFYGLMTKSPMAINFDSADIGKQAYYIGRWVTRRGLTGPWSAAINAAVV